MGRNLRITDDDDPLTWEEQAGGDGSDEIESAIAAAAAELRAKAGGSDDDEDEDEDRETALDPLPEPEPSRVVDERTGYERANALPGRAEKAARPEPGADPDEATDPEPETAETPTPGPKPEASPDAPVFGGAALEALSGIDPAALESMAEPQRRAVSHALETARTLEGMFAPFEASLRAQNMTPFDVVRQWHALNTFANDNPTGYAAFVATHKVPEDQRGAFITDLAKALGVSVSLAEAKDDADDPFADPELIEARRELEKLRRASQPAPTERFNAEVEYYRQMAAFQTATDDKGRALHPHYDRVAPVMAQIMQQRVAAGGQVYPADLSQIYQIAVAATPGLTEIAPQSSTTAPPASAAPARPADSKTAAAQRAMRASRTISPGTAGGGTPPARPGATPRPGNAGAGFEDPEGDIRAILQKLTG